MPINIPKNSDVAEAAAREIDSDVVVVVSISPDGEMFDTRIYGGNARKRTLAGRIADICLDAINSTDPDEDSDFNWSMVAATAEDQVAAETSDSAPTGDGE